MNMNTNTYEYINLPRIVVYSSQRIVAVRRSGHHALKWYLLLVIKTLRENSRNERSWLTTKYIWLHNVPFIHRKVSEFQWNSSVTSVTETSSPSVTSNWNRQTGTQEYVKLQRHQRTKTVNSSTINARREIIGKYRVHILVGITASPFTAWEGVNRAWSKQREKLSFLNCRVHFVNTCFEMLRI